MHIHINRESVTMCSMTETLTLSVSPDFESVRFVAEHQYCEAQLQVAPEDYEASIQTAQVLVESSGFQRLISPHGTFKFNIPSPQPRLVEDWTLSFLGYPRIADKINYEVLDELMGEEVVVALQSLAASVHERRESVGDIFSKERARGPVHPEDLDGVLADNITHLITAPNLNRRTGGRRAYLLATSPYIRLEGKYVVPRNLLITDAPDVTALS